jgi:hypothetical protein
MTAVFAPHHLEVRPDPAPRRHPGGETVLPLAVRQRLWDQLWTRLLAPPVVPADRAPTPTERQAEDGGPR